ncbi:MAG: SDR family oxidoreductase [Defluviitaleaceae bacterium]|nr:SDR family oxidoreductase [Defluviitaleaceae bacterium]
MNIFLTGASGFFGSVLLERLVKNEEIKKIYCLSRTGLPAIFLENEKVVLIKADINQLGEQFDLCGIEKGKIDVVIHLAAYLKRENAKKFEEVNVKGTESVIYFCKKNGINSIIHCSTINIKLQKKGGYARTKEQAEQLIIRSGLEYIIARPALIYGNSDTGLNRMLSSGRSLGLIPCFGTGKFLQQPIYVNELAAFFEKFIFAGQKNIVLELGGAEKLSYAKMCLCIGNVLGKNVKPFKLPARITLFFLAIIEFLRIPFSLRREQIYQVNQDLVCENHESLDVFGVKQKGFEENLRAYVKK